MKEQGKNPPNQTNEEEIDSLPEKEFRVMILKRIQNCGNRRKKIQETLNKDQEELKSKQTIMNNTINEIKNSLEGINSRITEEERISDLEDKIVEITTAEQNKEKRIEGSLRDLWDNIKRTNTRITGVPEEEEKKKGTEKIFEEIIVENFPNVGKEIVNQVQEVHRVPNRINPRRNMPRHILSHKLSKIKYKEKILKAAREKQQITYKGIPIRLTADFSAETLQARREWQDIFKVMKGKNLKVIFKPRLLYPARISFRFNREIKNFRDKQKPREFTTTKPALQQMLKELL
uniref:L1 transposable element RRM domain-containing protein n=1 Tax=Monodon monoceros TaxID=40151 RepID=A0A8C6CAP7_MONMO